MALFLVPNKATTITKQILLILFPLYLNTLSLSLSLSIYIYIYIYIYTDITLTNFVHLYCIVVATSHHHLSLMEGQSLELS